MRINIMRINIMDYSPPPPTHCKSSDLKPILPCRCRCSNWCQSQQLIYYDGGWGQIIELTLGVGESGTAGNRRIGPDDSLVNLLPRV